LYKTVTSATKTSLGQTILRLEKKHNSQQDVDLSNDGPPKIKKEKYRNT
jgi:hypothetical protein